MSTNELPGNDAELKEALDKLFLDWEKELKEKGCKEFKFSKDGALPGYFKQKYKILSIGWESHSDTPDLSGLVEYFLSHRGMKELNRKFRGKDAKPNSLNCWRLAAKIVYGLLQGEENWNAIPKKEELEEPFREGKFSFAVMNVSKYANPEGSKPSDEFFKYVNASLGDNDSRRNFIREEIELLNPDLIFTWNLKYTLAKKEEEERKKDKKDKKDKDEVFRKLFTESPDGPKNLDNSCGFLADRAWLYKFDDGREIPLLDTWHLSSWMKKDSQEDIYDPLMRAFSSKDVQKLIAKKKAQDKKRG